MIIDPVVFFSIVGITVVATITVAVIAVSYLKALKKLDIAQKQNSDYLQNIEKEKAAILKEAHEKSSQIISEAATLSQEIVSRGKKLDENATAILETQMNSISQNQREKFLKTSGEYIKLYEKTLSEVKEEDINIFKNISKDIQNSALDVVSQLKAGLQKATIDSQKEATLKIEEQYQAMQKDLEAYKDAQLKKIDESLLDIVQIAARTIFGRALTLDQQEAFIVKAIEAAKREMGMQEREGSKGPREPEETKG